MNSIQKAQEKEGSLFTRHLEAILCEMEMLEQTKNTSEQIRGVLDKFKVSGLDKDILKEMVEIRKVQKENPNLFLPADKLYNNLLKYKENTKEGFRYSPNL